MKSLILRRQPGLRGITAPALALLLAGAPGGFTTKAETVRSENPPVFDAARIPSLLELGLGEPIPVESSSAIPDSPLEANQNLPPFVRDSRLTLHLRNYYLTRDDLAGKDIESWAQGGWLRLISGRAWNVLSFGGTVYGSYRLYGPDDKDGSLLLKPSQENFAVLGELYGQINYARHELKFGRQEYNLPFLNKQDNRMIPNTFEGYHIAAPAKENPMFQYGAGYIARMKKRNADEFIPMSEAAGAPDHIDRGVIAGVGRYKITDTLSLEAVNLYTPDLINIFYGEVVSRLETDGGVGIKLSGQAIQQQAVDDEVLDRASDSTHAVGGLAEVSYRKAVATLALTGNSRSEDLISPYGTYAGYNSIIINDYNRAGEYGLRVGLSYDFSELGLNGVSAFGNYVWGFNAVDPETGKDIPNQDEFDLTLDYTFQGSWLKGLSIRLRTALIEEEGGSTLEDYRVIVNYAL